MARHNPGLLLEARQLREFGWTQQRIAETLIVPRKTISNWLKKNGHPTSGEMAKAIPHGHNATNSLATSITLYQAKYEVVP